jgi:general stress protein 26
MSTTTSDQSVAYDLVAQALNVIKDDPLPYLATIDGDQPRLRPIAPVKTEGFTVYFANLRSYGKTAEIEANPKVELCYVDNHHDQVRITGMAEVVTSWTLKEEVWNNIPYIRKYMISLDNPDFVLYKITPTRVRFMKEWAITYREVPIGQASGER